MLAASTCNAVRTSSTTFEPRPKPEPRQAKTLARVDPWVMATAFLFDWGSMLELACGHRLAPSLRGTALPPPTLGGRHAVGAPRKRKRCKADVARDSGGGASVLHVSGVNSLPSVVMKEQLLFALSRAASQQQWALFVGSPGSRRACKRSQRCVAAARRDGPRRWSLLPTTRRGRAVRALPLQMRRTIHMRGPSRIRAAQLPCVGLAAARYGVFADLWRRGFRVTPAFKFGGDFLAYAQDPMFCHAQVLILVVAPDALLTPRKLIQVSPT